MHRSWSMTTANGAFSTTAANGCGGGGGGGSGGNVGAGGKEVNNGLTDAVSPGRPALLPGVEDFDDPLQTCRDAGHVRIAGLRRPRIAGSW